MNDVNGFQKSKPVAFFYYQKLGEPITGVSLTPLSEREGDKVLNLPYLEGLEFLRRDEPLSGWSVVIKKGKKQLAKLHPGSRRGRYPVFAWIPRTKGRRAIEDFDVVITFYRKEKIFKIIANTLVDEDQNRFTFFVTQPDDPNVLFDTLQVTAEDVMFGIEIPVDASKYPKHFSVYTKQMFDHYLLQYRDTIFMP